MDDWREKLRALSSGDTAVAAPPNPDNDWRSSLRAAAGITSDTPKPTKTTTPAFAEPRDRDAQPLSADEPNYSGIGRGPGESTIAAADDPLPPAPFAPSTAGLSQDEIPPLTKEPPWLRIPGRTARPPPLPVAPEVAARSQQILGERKQREQEQAALTRQAEHQRKNLAFQASEPDVIPGVRGLTEPQRLAVRMAAPAIEAASLPSDLIQGAANRLGLDATESPGSIARGAVESINEAQDAGAMLPADAAAAKREAGAEILGQGVAMLPSAILGPESVVGTALNPAMAVAGAAHKIPFVGKVPFVPGVAAYTAASKLPEVVGGQAGATDTLGQALSSPFGLPADTVAGLAAVAGLEPTSSPKQILDAYKSNANLAAMLALSVPDAVRMASGSRGPSAPSGPPVDARQSLLNTLPAARRASPLERPPAEASPAAPSPEPPPFLKATEVTPGAAPSPNRPPLSGAAPSVDTKSPEPPAVLTGGPSGSAASDIRLPGAEAAAVGKPSTTGLPEAFASAKNAATDSFVDSAWDRISNGKRLLFSDKPDTIEQRIQAAADAGAIKSREDVARIVAQPQSQENTSVPATAAKQPHEMTRAEFDKARPAVPGYLYHGSPEGDITEFDPYYHTKTWVEGQGPYATENIDKARGYALGRTAGKDRKAGAAEKGRVNYVRSGAKRVLDMDQPADTALWQKAADDLGIDPPEGAKTNADAFKGIRLNAAEQFGSLDDGYYAVEEWLRDKFDATVHTEGTKTGQPHRVTIFKGDAGTDKTGKPFNNISGRVIPPGDVHRGAVEQAQREGKFIPPEVLAEYPDLQKGTPNEVKAAPPETVPVQGQAESPSAGGVVGAGTEVNARPRQADVAGSGERASVGSEQPPQGGRAGLGRGRDVSEPPFVNAASPADVANAPAPAPPPFVKPAAPPAELSKAQQRAIDAGRLPKGRRKPQAARVGIGDARKAVLAIHDRYADIITGDAPDAFGQHDNGMGGQDESPYRPAYTFKSKADAQEVKDRLPFNLHKNVRVDPSNLHADGADIKGDIGPDAMAESIKQHAADADAPKIRRTIDFIKQNWERLEDGAEAKYAVDRLELLESGDSVTAKAAKGAKPQVLPAEVLKPGDTMKIHGEEYHVEKIDDTRGMVRLKDGTEVEVPIQADVAVDSGTLKESKATKRDVAAPPFVEPTGTNKAVGEYDMLGQPIVRNLFGGEGSAIPGKLPAAKPSALDRATAESGKRGEDTANLAKTFPEKLTPPFLEGAAPAEAPKPTGFAERLRAAADAERAKLRKAIQDGKLFSNPFDPDLLKSAAIIGADHIVRGVTAIKDFAEKMVGEFGEKIRPHIDAIFAHAKRIAETGDLEAAPENGPPPRGRAPNALTDEESGQRVTSTKNAVVDQEREARGLPQAMEEARQSQPELWDRVMREVDEKPFVQTALIAELKARPRPIDGRENFLILHRQVVLQNEFEKAAKSLDEAQRSGDPARLATESTYAAQLSSELLDIYNINKATGREWGRAGVARQQLAKEDFSLAAMTVKARVANEGRPLTADQTAEIKAAHEEIAKWRAAAEKATAEAEAAQKESEVLKQASKPVRKIPAKLRSLADRWEKEAEDALRAKGATLQSGIDPALLRDYAKWGAAQILRGVASVADLATKLAERFGDDVFVHADEIYKEASKLSEKVMGSEKAKPEKAAKGKAAPAAGRSEATGPDQPNPHQIALELVRKGVKGRDALIDAVHEELKKTNPKITRRETMDAISGYGDFKQLDKEQAKVELRALKGEMQQVAKLEDMQGGKAPAKTGVERRAPSDEERQLIKQVNEAKKAGGFVVTDPAKQLASTLDSLKTRLKHQIADMTRQITERARDPGRKKFTAFDAEARKLMAQRDVLKQQYDTVFGKAEMSDAQRLKLATAAVEKSIAEYDRRIKEKDTSPRAAAKTAETPELKSLRDKRAALKAEYDKLVGKRELTDAQRVKLAIDATGRSIAEYERRIREKDTGPRPESTTPITPELAALRTRREALAAEYKELVDLANPKKTPEERANAAYKTATTRRIADLESRMARDDYSPKPKNPLKLDSDAADARYRYEKVKAQYAQKLEAWRRKNRTPVAKATDAVGQTAHLMRSVFTGFDFSAVLRQGALIAAGHPLMVAKSLPGMFKVSADIPSFLREDGIGSLKHPIRAAKRLGDLSKRAMFRATEEIAGRPNAVNGLYKRSGLALTDIHGPGEMQEEKYIGRWNEHVPFLAASERAYSYELNRLRADLFDAVAANVGRNNSVSDAEAKVIANAVNVFSARGNLGEAGNRAASSLATVFFSPRAMLARFQFVLGQPLWHGLLKGPKEMSLRNTYRARAAVAVEYARTLAGLGALYAAVATYKKLNNDDSVTLDFDPRSSDFGKIRIGNTRIDPLGGLSSTAVLLGRLTSGETRTPSGEIRSLRADAQYGRSNIRSTIGDFLNNKLSPVLATALDVDSGATRYDGPTTPWTIAKGTVVPLAFQDIYAAMKDRGVPEGAAIGLLAIFGAGVQSYESPPNTPERREIGNAKREFEIQYGPKAANKRYRHALPPFLKQQPAPQRR